jgi:hypothetical protein
VPAIEQLSRSEAPPSEDRFGLSIRASVRDFELSRWPLSVRTPTPVKTQPARVSIASDGPAASKPCCRELDRRINSEGRTLLHRERERTHLDPESFSGPPEVLG